MPSVTTDQLTIAYSDEGPRNGVPVLLIHGWPDDASTWDDVVPHLHAAGLRTIVPTLRGFGDTRLADGVARTGNSAMLAMDMIALMDALSVERFMVAGHDWGSNAAEALAVGWPDRVQRLAMLSSPPRLGGMPTPPFEQTQRQWYHWFMATSRGAEAVRADRCGFARLHWENWSPPWPGKEAAFERTAPSWNNPDWADVTLHSYRARWDEAEPDPRSRWLEERVAATKTLSLPAIYIQGSADGVNPPSASTAVPSKFSNFPQRETPAAIARHLVGLFARDPATLADTIDRSLFMHKAKPFLAVAAAAGVIAAVAGVAQAQRGSSGLTQVAQFDHQATGVAVVPDGRRFVNFPRWTDDAPISVAEVMKDGSLRPYPDARCVNRRPKRTPYRRPKGTPFVERCDGYGGRTFRACCGVGRA